MTIFILIIFKFMNLREEKEICWKIAVDKERCWLLWFQQKKAKLGVKKFYLMR